MTEYRIKAYIWITAESEEEAVEKLKNEVTILGVLEVEEI